MVQFGKDIVTLLKKLILELKTRKYSVCLNSIYPSKELCSKIALGEVGVSLPW